MADTCEIGFKLTFSLEKEILLFLAVKKFYLTEIVHIFS